LSQEAREPGYLLAVRALRVSARFNDDLHVPDALAELDALGDAACAVVGEGDEAERLSKLLLFLCNEQGFRGNRDNYRDPRNSYLDSVLERRLGTPLSLSILLVAVAERVGIALRPVGFPTHFLVRYDAGNEPILIDAFNGGALLDEAGCRKLLEHQTRGRVPFDPRFLRATPAPAIVLRMLRNIKAAHLDSGEVDAVIKAIDGILEIRPGLWDEVRDRGLLSVKIGELIRARDYMGRYLAANPAAADAAAIRMQLERVTHRLA
jgi:regulator of sirC expression with transglutaminase-like and TPR domain